MTAHQNTREKKRNEIFDFITVNNAFTKGNKLFKEGNYNNYRGHFRARLFIFVRAIFFVAMRERLTGQSRFESKKITKVK